MTGKVLFFLSESPRTPSHALRLFRFLARGKVTCKVLIFLSESPRIPSHPLRLFQILAHLLSFKCFTGNLIRYGAAPGFTLRRSDSCLGPCMHRLVQDRSKCCTLNLATLILPFSTFVCSLNLVRRLSANNPSKIKRACELENRPSAHET